MKAKIASTVLSVTTALWMGGIGYFIPIAAHAQTAADLQAQIQLLLAQIATLQSQLTVLQGGSPGFSHVFNTNLKVGVTSDEVKALQQALDLEGCFTFGTYTGYFGPITRDAVNCFQNKYASEILTPLGLTAPTGFVGAGTRAKLNAMYGGGTVTPSPTPTPVPVGGNTLWVQAGTQPKDSLAVENAAGLPFTVFTLTAGSQDVVVDSITVERQGLGSDGAFTGLIVLDSDGTRIGLSTSLNSDHQAKLAEDITVKAGATRTLTIGADMDADLATEAGETPIIAIISIALKGGATLTGSLPIKGAIHTVNQTLSIGTVTMAVGPLDPGASVTKRVGDANGYTFSSVKVTAGSSEKILLKNIRWNQSGAVAATDLANLKTYVDGTAYDAMISSDGKYYTTLFGTDGILIDKGFAKEISIKGDIISGSGRSVDFDIFRRQDIVVSGQTFGYNITPPNGTDSSGTDDGAFHLDTNPWFDAYQVTVSEGSLTVENATAVPAQNVAENVPNQPMGGINVEVKGEEISVAQMVFQLGVGSSGGARGDDLTNITLVDESGAVVAGPKDGVVGGTVTFTETVIFPVGKKAYSMKGKYGTDFSNNDTVQASTTPSTQWTTVRGQITGVSITPSPTTSVAANTMTLKAPAITISVSSVPIARTIVAGVSGFTFANYQLDATNSGDDIKFASLPLEYRVGSNLAVSTATDVSGCKLYDGATAVTDSVSPTAAASSSVFTFLGTGLTVPKGTVKTVTMKCNISSGATADSEFSWGYDSSSSPSPTGIQSGQSVATADITENDSMGQLMTIAANGSYTVVDDSTPGYTIVNSGATGVTLGKFKFSATNEDIDIRRVNFQLNSAASNTPIDLVGQELTLWVGTTQIATAVFGGGGDYATSSLIAGSAFTIPQGSSKTLIVKGDIAAITQTGPLTSSGDLLIVDYDGNANGLNNGNYGVGAGSATNISPTSADTALIGVRIFKSYPSLTKIDLSSSESVMTTGSDRTVYKFKAKALGGDVHLAKFSFQVSSSTGNVASATSSKYSLYAYTDSGFALPDTSFSSNGLLNANQCYFNDDTNNGRSIELGVANTVGLDGIDIAILPDKSATTCGSGNDGTATTTYKIPSGEERWFKFALDFAGVESSAGTESVEVRLMGDAAYPTTTPDPVGNVTGITTGNAATVSDDTNDDFIWGSPSTTTNPLVGDLDYTNGYLVPGLPTLNMSHNTITSTN